MKLTIAIVTMNRSKQLLEAIKSCVSCDLPTDTHFVIIDNASIDNTEDVVNSFFTSVPYSYFYEKMAINLGAGQGRNVAFQHVNSEYVYFLDDDAYIDATRQRTFFLEGIKILDNNPDIMTLTTQIYDIAWKRNRVRIDGPKLNDELFLCYMVCGGSHFLRCKFFENQNPYFDNKYGYEELQPSLRVYDANKLNVFAPNLLAIHNPSINKWDFGKIDNSDTLVGEIANQKAIKGQVYSKWTYPMVCLAYYLRCRRHLSKEQKSYASEIVTQLVSSYNFGKRIKLRTVIRLFWYFGFSIF